MKEGYRGSGEEKGEGRREMGKGEIPVSENNSFWESSCP